MDLTLHFMKLIVHILNFKLSQIVFEREQTKKTEKKRKNKRQRQKTKQ